jgi:hypothetical protein
VACPLTADRRQLPAGRFPREGPLATILASTASAALRTPYTPSAADVLSGAVMLRRSPVCVNSPLLAASPVQTSKPCRTACGGLPPRGVVIQDRPWPARALMPDAARFQAASALAGRAPTCPKQQSAAVAHGQQRSAVGAAELRHRWMASSSTVLPKLVVRLWSFPDQRATGPQAVTIRGRVAFPTTTARPRSGPPSSVAPSQPREEHPGQPCHEHRRRPVLSGHPRWSPAPTACSAPPDGPPAATGMAPGGPGSLVPRLVHGRHAAGERAWHQRLRGVVRPGPGRRLLPRPAPSLGDGAGPGGCWWSHLAGCCTRPSPSPPGACSTSW